MNVFLLTMVSVSVSGSLAALFVLILRFMFGKSLSHTWHYYIWLIVLVRLLLPYAIETNLTGSIFTSLYEMVNNNEINPDANTGFVADDTNTPQLAPHSEYKTQQTVPGNYEASKSTPIWELILDNLALFWMCVCIVIAVWKTIKHFSFLKFIRASRFDPLNSDILAVYDQVCEEMNIRRPPQVYLDKAIASPLFAGVFRKFILLPESGFTEAQLACVFRHELTHYKRKDIWYKWLVQTVLCIHWYNPLIYWIAHEVNRRCELSCDEMVIGKMDRETKQIYGDTLMAAINGNGSYTGNTAVVTLNENAKTLKERLESIMKFKPKTRYSIVFSLILALLVATGATYAGAYTNSSDSGNGTLQKTPAKYYVDEGQLLESSSEEKKENKKAGDGQEVNTEKDIDGNKTTYGRITSTRGGYENSYIVIVEVSNFAKDTLENPVTINNSSSPLTVYFTEKTLSYSTNQTVLTAIHKIIQGWIDDGSLQRLIQSDEWYFRVKEIAGPYVETADTLAYRFFEEDDLFYFSAVIESASETTRKDLQDKSIEEDRVDYFSILKNQPNINADELAEKFYQDRKIDFFSVVIYDAGSEKKQELLGKAYDDGRQNIFSVLLHSGLDVDYDYYADQCYQDRKIAFFSIVIYETGSEKKQELLGKAYDDGRQDFFSVLLHSGMDIDYDFYAEKFYEDNNENYFAIVLYELSSEKKIEFLERAYNDNELNFFSMLLYQVGGDIDIDTYRDRAYQDNKREFFNVMWYYG